MDTEDQAAVHDNNNNDNEEQQRRDDDEEEEEDDDDDSKKEEEELVAKVNKLMDMITASPDNPKPTVLHALATILETQESRYMAECGPFANSNGRAGYNIGRLGSIIRENDEFFELISSKFLLETGYSTSVQVASARLLLCCSLTWIYPHVFEEPVIHNIKEWVLDDNARSSAEDQSLKHNAKKKEASDSEMLKTYATGLFAVCLIGGGKVVEDALSCSLSAKLMHYLRLRVMGETSSSHKDTGHLSGAVATVIDAAVEVSRSSGCMNTETENMSCRETDSGEDLEDYVIPDTQSLAKLREKYCIQCLVLLGEYVEALGPVLHEKGVDVCLALLQQNSKHQEPSKVALMLPDVMKLICALAAHRKFAALFVDRGGIQKLLAVPRMTPTFVGLSSFLFTICSPQIMERVCALPSDVVYHVVELGLQLLECNQDQARKNAAVFFVSSFSFRAILDAFDAQDGLQKLLGLLSEAASVRSGVNSGALGLSNTGTLRNDRSSAEVLTSSEKQIAYHTCTALRQYFRAHLILLVDSIHPNKNTRGAARNIPSARAVYKPLDISNEAIDAVFLQLQKDRMLGPAFVRTRWPPVEKFLAYNGHITMLELCQAPPVERYMHDFLQFALGVLRIVTLLPSSRKMIVNTTLSNNRVGIAVILDAANIVGSHVDPEIDYLKIWSINI